MQLLQILMFPLVTTVGLILLIQPIMKSSGEEKFGIFLFYTILLIHNLFQTITKSLDAVPLKSMEYIIYYALVWLIFSFLFKGKGIRNFVMVYAIDFIFKTIYNVILRLIVGAFCHFDLNAMEQKIKLISPENDILFLISFTVSILASRTIIKLILKKCNKNLYILATVFTGANMLVEAFNSVEKVYFIISIVVIMLVIGMIYQEKQIKQKDEQARYYQMLEQKQKIRQEELVRIRNDIANHIQTIESTNNKEYANEVLGCIDRNIRCGVPILDCLLEEKEKLCREKQICFYSEWIDLSDSKVTNFEWIGLMANLLDNAIEACEKLSKDRKIELIIKRKDYYLVCSLINSKSSEVKPIRNNFISSKRQGKEHGYGTRIINGIVEKYNGDIAYEDTQDQLKIHIIMQAWEYE